jgi:hypothetical protein
VPSSTQSKLQLVVGFRLTTTLTATTKRLPPAQLRSLVTVQRFSPEIMSYDHT